MQWECLPTYNWLNNRKIRGLYLWIDYLSCINWYIRVNKFTCYKNIAQRHTKDINVSSIDNGQYKLRISELLAYYVSLVEITCVSLNFKADFLWLRIMVYKHDNREAYNVKILISGSKVISIAVWHFLWVLKSTIFTVIRYKCDFLLKMCLNHLLNDECRQEQVPAIWNHQNGFRWYHWCFHSRSLCSCWWWQLLLVNSIYLLEYPTKCVKHFVNASEFDR